MENTKIERCIASHSPDRVSAVSCREVATVKLREQRSAAFKAVAGRDYTIHLMCESDARDMLASPRFSVLERSVTGFTAAAYESA